MNIWFDITTTKQWIRPAVGIVRVETELLRFLMDCESLPFLRFCHYQKETYSFLELSHEEVRRHLHRIFSFSEHAHQPISSNNGTQTKAIEKKGLFSKLLKKNEKPCAIKTNSVHNKIEFSEKDIHISLGLDWDYKNMHHLYVLKKDKNLRSIFMCYDLIPILFPHYCVGDVAAYFSKYFIDMSWAAQHIMCISENSRNDLKKFLNTVNVPVPETSVITLGSNLSGNSIYASSTVRHLQKDSFLLFVSTIERRKNHETIYKALTRLASLGLDPMPKMVFVGMQGWGINDLMMDIKLDPKVKNHILILNNLNDNDLAFLYENCLFTLYPSIYEGWGLPVAESLLYGKFCISSNVASLPEVGRNLVDYVDPWSVNNWAEKILYYWMNPDKVKEKEIIIRNANPAYKWEEAGLHLLNVIGGLK